MSDRPAVSLPPEEDEDATARLLRLAGPRPEVAPDRAGRVRDAVRQRWQADVRRRVVRRRMAAATISLGMAAALMLILRVATPGAPTNRSASEVLATTERVEGDVRLRAAEAAVSGRLSSADVVRQGDWVETGGRARAALRLADGTSMRLDIDSRLRLLAANVIELTNGAVYLDTSRHTAGLQVRTPHGTARDIGTQFEVRLGIAALRLRVRTGVVELHRDGEALSARAGTELTTTASGTTRRSIPIDGPEWEWAARLAAPFAIEGRPLASFLEHLCREQGWTLRYADAALARDASSVILHGSVEGLQSQDALAVALTTSGLAHRFQDGELLVFRPANPE